jgi:hypothetical protein
VAYTRLESWLRECKNNHRCTPPAANPPLPTRVLDVFASERSVSLLQTRGQRGRYIALSHTVCFKYNVNVNTLTDSESGAPHRGYWSPNRLWKIWKKVLRSRFSQKLSKMQYGSQRDLASSIYGLVGILAFHDSVLADKF